MRKTIALLIALLAAPAGAQDLPGTEFTFGLWHGAGQADAAGRFSHCYATLSFASGDQLWVNVTRDDLVEVIFSFAGQSYTTGQTFQASLMLETGLPAHGPAHALGEKLVAFNLTPLEDAHAFLAQGSWLRLMGVGNDEAYDARGLGGVLGKLRMCRESQRS